MATTRPIDEELTRLHHPVITENDDMDEYDALEGFSVASSGSVMIPSGAFSNPHLYRQSSTSSYGNSSYGSMGYPSSYVVYDGQHQAMMYAQSQSLPRSLPRYSSSLPNSFPSSLPTSYSHQQYHQQHMHLHLPQVVYPSYEYPSGYPQQGMNGW